MNSSKRSWKNMPLVWSLSVSTIVTVLSIMGLFTLVQHRLENQRERKDHRMLLDGFLSPIIADIESAPNLKTVIEKLLFFHTTCLEHGHLDLQLELRDGNGKIAAISSPSGRGSSARTLVENIPVLSAVLPGGHGHLSIWEDDMLLSSAVSQRWRNWLFDLVVMIGCILCALLPANYFLVTRPLRRFVKEVRLMGSGYQGHLETIGGAREWTMLAAAIRQLGNELEETVRHLVEAERVASGSRFARDSRPSASGGAPAPQALQSPYKNWRQKMVRLYLQDKCRLLEERSDRDPETMAYAREVWERDVAEAERLNLMDIRTRLDDAAFRILYPEDFERVNGCLKDLTRTQAEWLEKRAREMKESMERENVRFLYVVWRIKHAAGIFRKMQANGLALEQVQDIFAFRVIVLDVKQCYKALAAIHQRFEPLLLRFKDYIANPKPNGYQSIHTCVRADNGFALEVQIRTEAMQQQAEGGTAAHWRYKVEQHNGVERDSKSLHIFQKWRRNTRC